MIKKGSVSVWKGKELLRSMKEGEAFGENALYSSSARGATVKCDTEVIVLSLGRENLK